MRRGARGLWRCAGAAHPPARRAPSLAGWLTWRSPRCPAMAAVDAHGDVLFPLPLAHRQMASSPILPHIAQVQRPAHAWPLTPACLSSQPHATQP